MLMMGWGLVVELLVLELAPPWISTRLVNAHRQFGLFQARPADQGVGLDFFPKSYGLTPNFNLFDVGTQVSTITVRVLPIWLR